MWWCCVQRSSVCSDDRAADGSADLDRRRGDRSSSRIYRPEWNGADNTSGESILGLRFVFRGRRGDLIKILWFDGDGLCLFAKRLERGRFIWPQVTSGTVALTPAQLSMLLEGIDWRARYAATIHKWRCERKDFCYFPARFHHAVKKVRYVRAQWMPPHCATSINSIPRH